MRNFLTSTGIIALFIVFSSVALSGCNLFTTKVGPAVSKAVVKYCETPVEVRDAIRNEVNAAIKPNSVEVTCVSIHGIKSK